MRILTIVTLAALLSLGCDGQGTQTGSGTKSGTGSISTIPPSDTTPPQISAISCLGSDTQIACSWTTNEVATTKICRGATGGPYGTCSTEDVALTTSHSGSGATLTGLTAATAYFYVVISTDAAGNTRTCNSDGTGGSACPSATELSTTTDAAASGNPPYGSTSTAAILPRSHSEAFPYPAASTISAITCTAGTCTVDTSAAHNLLTGDFVHITGTGVASQTVDDTAITDCARTSPSTTVTCNTGAAFNFATGERIYIEGSNLVHVQGSWAVASTPTTTQFTFTSLETATRSLTTGTANFAVAITKVDADTFTYVHTGAAGSAVTGTVTSTRVLPPAPGSTYTENSVLNAPIRIVTYSSSSAAQDNSTLYQFHSTQPPVDAGNTYILLNQNSGWGVFTIADGLSACTPTDGGASAFRWDRVTANKMWRFSGTTLQYRESFAPSNCNGTWTSENNFATSHSCTSITMGFGESRSTTLGGRIAIGCQTGTSPNTYKYIVWNTSTHVADGVVTGPSAGFGDVDYMHIVEDSSNNLLGIGVRSLTSGPESCTASRASDTVTFTCAAGSFLHVTAGEKFRTFKCAADEYNRQWTIDSATTSMLVATQAGLSAASTTACKIGTQWRGMTFWKNNGGTLTYENTVRWGGSHGEWGRDQDNEAVWIGVVNVEPVCATNSAGGVSHKGLASYWTAGTSNYTGAKQCLIDYRPFDNGSSDLHISTAQGWTSLNPYSTNSVGPQGAETSITTNWSVTQWPAYEGEIILCKLVTPGDPNVCYRQAHAYNTLGMYFSYASFSDNKRWLTWNCNIRYANGSQKGAVCAVDLGVW